MRLDVTGVGMTSLRTRERMVQRLIDKGIGHPKVLAALRATPRHVFVDEALASRAYEDTALPIGFNQTISQPFIVARMTELLITAQPVLRKVLEIGTGCGYQTAILAHLAEHVYTVERIQGLQRQAKNRVWGLGLKNVSYLHNDGGWGWPDHAPYDGILVTAAPETLPDALLEQLADGGVIITPLGTAGGQYLHQFRRQGQEVEVERLTPVSFVPFLAGKQ
ncbi:MAG: protein-L-isoaspartate(D-aspartate) O-methyltransferase [Methylococcales bacterium]|nr:protein-L-isoaspartate(D-aspartate) O-methyltransferase [Methylococcales bacterium]